MKRRSGQQAVKADLLIPSAWLSVSASLGSLLQSLILACVSLSLIYKCSLPIIYCKYLHSHVFIALQSVSSAVFF